MPQSWDPASYDRNARFVSDLGGPILDWLQAQAGERILDLGCGDGVLTAQLAQIGCAVVGVDASAAMVAAACSRGVEAQVMDGQALTFREEFDAVFSNAALHWMLEPHKVLAGVWRALKPGGRFVAEFGGQGNVASIVRALEAALRKRGHAPPKPWFFPSPAQYRAMLGEAGFAVGLLRLHPRPTLLPGGLGDWLETFAQPFTADIDAGERQAFLREVVDSLQDELRDAAGRWCADYVRLRVYAVKACPGV